MSNFSTPRNKRSLGYGASSTKLRLLVDHDPAFGMKRLKLGGRELEDLPRELFELTDLEYLALSPDRKSCLFFRLHSVPRDIQRLVNLRVLCLDTNELTELHASVCQLVQLERLVLSNNLLTTLPSDFRELQQLKSLHLANNYYEEIPEAVFDLKQLEFIDVSDNKILKVSDRIGELSNLEALLMLYNLLEELPESIGKCSNLRNLWLGMNRLTTLPRGIGRLLKLDWAEHSHSSNLDGNPLVYPPIEVCRRGPSSIERYYEMYSTPSGAAADLNVSDIDEDDPGILSDDSGSSLGESFDRNLNGNTFRVIIEGTPKKSLDATAAESVENGVNDAGSVRGGESVRKPRRPDNRPGRQRPSYNTDVD
ncbi:uncharacterized protein [Diadema setosum]|uniref:uncharacterized protein n=1 Tax=Diadema setosum TaxID=31175 RepID=UPI003B3A1C96